MTNKRSMKVDYEDTPRIEKFPLFRDERGFFSPTALNDSWCQSNISFNEKLLTLRGIHYQEGSFAQAKTVHILTGKILDMIIDIRPESSNFGEVEFYYMEAGDSITIPRGYGHCFLTLEANTIVEYFVDNIYSQNHEGIIAWDSVDQIEELVLQQLEDLEVPLTISQKDKLAEPWEDFKRRVLPD